MGNAGDALAIEGGRKTRERAFPPWPVYSRAERDAADAVLASGRVNVWTGELVRTFEREYAAALGRRHAIALANGTVALELALRALGVGADDEVIVPSRTFIATASAAVTLGARPVVADIDPTSGNVTAATIEARVTDRTKAVIPVHVGGWPCEMDEIRRLASERGIFVIEDCAQAHGATIAGRPVGTFSDIAAFSFCQDKIITTAGEGGMIVLDDEAAWSRAWSYKDHGKDFATVFRKDHPPGYRWLHASFGTNWRLTELQAAIGRVQLAGLGAQVEKRRALASTHAKRLAGAPGLTIPEPPAHMRSAYYRQYALVDPAALRAGWDRDRIVAAVAAEGVPCSSGSCSEIHLEKAFTSAGLAPRERLPVARMWTERSIALLTHPTMEIEDAADVAAAIDKVMGVATRS